MSSSIILKCDKQHDNGSNILKQENASVKRLNEILFINKLKKIQNFIFCQRFAY